MTAAMDLAVSDTGRTPIGIAWIDAGVTLAPDYFERCATVLRTRPDVGIVTAWWWEGNRLVAPPQPAFPYQWLHNEVAPFAVLRVEAVEAVGRYRESLDAGYELWDTANAMLAAGWAAICLPRPQATVERGRGFASPPAHTPAAMRRLLLERLPDVVARDAVLLQLLSPAPSGAGPAPHAPTHAGLLRTAARHPLRSVAALVDRVLRRIRALRRHRV